jgi:hypothetical protein
VVPLLLHQELAAQAPLSVALAAAAAGILVEAQVVLQYQTRDQAAVAELEDTIYPEMVAVCQEQQAGMLRHLF